VLHAMAKRWCSRFLQDERAQDLVEYALLLAGS
jgi:Flp pilus assembly pilin Flp